MRKMVIMARNNGNHGITPFNTFGMSPFGGSFMFGDPFGLIAPRLDFDRSEPARTHDLMKALYDIDKPLRCDVKETDDAYEISADIPGVDKNDIDVDLDNDNILTISYSHDDGENKEEKDGEGNVIYRCRERSTVSGSRSFKIGDADRDNIHASYSDGVLTVTVGKTKETEPKKKSIDIE